MIWCSTCQRAHSSTLHAPTSRPAPLGEVCNGTELGVTIDDQGRCTDCRYPANHHDY